MTDIHIDRNPLRWKPLKWWFLALMALIWAAWVSQDPSLINPGYLI